MSIASVHPAQRPAASWRRASVLVGASLITAACASALHGPSSGSTTERTRAVHLLNRATYGARPADVDQVLRLGVERWLEQQMRPAPPPVVAIAPPADTPKFTVTMRGTTPAPGTPAEQARMQLMQATVLQLVSSQSIGTLVQTKLTLAVESERQLEEVMTDFWFNHFNVNFNKGTQVRQTIADYERNAIRKHVFGRFEDMLLATAQHPAMLVYLDNFQSTAPLPAGRPPTRGSPAGLNENYARELLELHTLGVDGGYTQQDVIEVARAFTGWGIATRAGTRATGNTPATAASIDFRFDPARHDAGEKKVLGHTLPADRGSEDGTEIIRTLAQHPSTAQHVATKLVRHFVADDPPRSLVDELATVFRKSDGDLRAVTRALFMSREFYDPAHYRAKTKRPFEFIASALRVSGARIQQNAALVTQLRAFGHLPYSEPAPTGYPTTAEAWLSAGAMMNRMRFAFDLAGGRVTGVQLQPHTIFGEAAPQASNVSTRQPARGTAIDPSAIGPLTTTLLEHALPGVPTDRLATLIEADLAQLNDRRVVMARALGLVLGSPEFQRY